MADLRLPVSVEKALDDYRHGNAAMQRNAIHAVAAALLRAEIRGHELHCPDCEDERIIEVSVCAARIQLEAQAAALEAGEK